jgi:tetratricopeptide (TPR) repeat protein
MAPAALLGALLIFVAGRCLCPMDETDLFFNLRLGEVVLRTHGVPTTNLLSFTWPDARDVNLAWLFQVVLALAHRAGGIPATVILKTGFVLATFVVLWRVGRRRGAHPALLAAVLALAAWAAEPRFVERPHLVTFLGLALALLAVERAEAGRARSLWALIPAGLVWANANSCFFLAPAVLLLYALGALIDERRGDARRAALVAAALAPLILATPSRAAAFGYIANHFRLPYLRPLQEYRAASWPLDGPFFFLCAAVAAAIACAPRGRWRTFLPVIALALLGARRIRFVAEFALLAAPAIAAAVIDRLKQMREDDSASAVRPGRVSAAAIASGAVATALLLLAIGPRVADASAGRPFIDLGVEAGLVPETAIRFAEREGLRDRMYNDLEVGSYLTWDGWPRYRVFQDPRINGYPDEFHAILRRADLGRAEWQDLMDRFGVTSALITYPSVNPRGALFDPARWALVYRDREALIFARRGPKRARVIAAHELPLTFRFDAATGLVADPLAAPPAGAAASACEWSLRLGDFWLETSAAGRAKAAYEAATPCLDPPRQRALASLDLETGDAEGAVRLLAGLPDPEAHVRRGFALLRLARAEEALADFAAAARAGGDVDATLGRALALEALHRNDEAVAAYRDFLKRAPDHIGAGEARAHLERLGAPH